MIGTKFEYQFNKKEHDYYSLWTIIITNIDEYDDGSILRIEGAAYKDYQGTSNDTPDFAFDFRDNYCSNWWHDNAFHFCAVEELEIFKLIGIDCQRLINEKNKKLYPEIK